MGMVCCRYVCLCTKYVLGVCGGHKKASYALKLELWMVSTCCVGAGNWALVLLQSKQWTWMLSHLSSPVLIFKCGDPSSIAFETLLNQKGFSSLPLPNLKYRILKFSLCCFVVCFFSRSRNELNLWLRNSRTGLWKPYITRKEQTIVFFR